MKSAKRATRPGPPRRRAARAARPEAEIRRFDVFAEWKRLEALDRLRLAPSRDFYRRVFGPALREAWGRGLEYEGIRDSIRADWNRRQASTL